MSAALFIRRITYVDPNASMTASALWFGLALVVVGVATLYVTRQLFLRFDLADDYRHVVQLLVAIGAGLTITFGLVLMLLGVIAG